MPTLVVAGATDRKVSVEEAYLDGAEAHVVVPSGHTLILMRPSVMRLVARYLAGNVITGEKATRRDGGNRVTVRLGRE